MSRTVAIALTLVALLTGPLLLPAQTRPASLPAVAERPSPRPARAWSSVHIETRTGCRYVAYEGDTRPRRVSCRKPTTRSSGAASAAQPKPAKRP